LAKPFKDVLAILEVPGGEAAWGLFLRLAPRLDCSGRSWWDEEGELRHPRGVVTRNDLLVAPRGNVLARVSGLLTGRQKTCPVPGGGNTERLVW